MPALPLSKMQWCSCHKTAQLIPMITARTVAFIASTITSIPGPQKGSNLRACVFLITLTSITVCGYTVQYFQCPCIYSINQSTHNLCLHLSECCQPQGDQHNANIDIHGADDSLTHDIPHIPHHQHDSADAPPPGNVLMILILVTSTRMSSRMLALQAGMGGACRSNSNTESACNRPISNNWRCFGGSGGFSNTCFTH
jgi:hypothetical protein